MILHNSIINPTGLTIITTYRCTAACKNCCFQCTPKRNEQISIEDIKMIIDYFIEEFPTIKIIIFTGGEPFILGERLNEAVKHASEKGRLVRIISNGYWAKNYKIAYNILEKLKENGLSEINFSTGDEHLEWIPYDNIVYAIRASMDLSLPTSVNVESHETKLFQAEQLHNESRLKKYQRNPELKILNGNWMPITNESKELYKRTLPNHKNSIIEGCETLFTNISISPDLICNSCCGFFSVKTHFLRFGQAKNKNIKERFINQFDDFIKIWLSVEGPIPMAKFINKKTNTTSIDYINKHPCAICEEIISNSDHIKVIKSNLQEMLGQILFKYHAKQRLLCKQ